MPPADPSSARNPPDLGRLGSPPPGQPGAAAPRRPPAWPLPAAGLLLVLLAHPLTWGRPSLPLCLPSAGLGLVLVAWLGWRSGGAVLAAAGLLVAARQAAALAAGGERPLDDLSWALASGTLLPLEAAGAWWAYHTLARGSARMADPRSAMGFVLLVPGLAAGLSGAAHLALAALIGSPDLGPGGPLRHLAVFWLPRALGMLIVAPPLLVVMTPWLLRGGWLRTDGLSRDPHAGPPVPFADLTTPDDDDLGTGSRLGDWVEVAGLALAAAVLCLLLSRLHQRAELLGWQLWGGQLLLIVWASMRQGLRGGTLAASAAAAAPLADWAVYGFAPPDQYFRPLMQAHLVAQCSAALLVAAGSSWARRREAGYRRIVSLVPVVIYSARLLRPPRSSDPPREKAQALDETPRTASGHRRSPGPGMAEVTLVSAASRQLLGRAPDELLGDYARWLRCVHAEDRELLLAALEQLDRQDQPVVCEYRLAAADSGSARRSASLPSEAHAPPARWLRDTMAPRRDPEGRLRGWDGVVAEISEQRELADDLRRTTSMFNALVSNLPAGVFFVQGPHGLPILVNARARSLLGQREDASAGLEQLPSVYRLFRPDGTLYPADELPVFLALRHGRTTMRDDIVVHRADGRRVPLVTWAAPVHLSGKGGAAAAVWVLEDLTSLHQAEAARRDTEGRLRAVIETMAEGLLVHDPQGRIASANPAAAAFFGRTADALAGRTLAELAYAFCTEAGAPIDPGELPTAAALRGGRAVRNVVLGVRPRGLSESGSVLQSRWLLVNAVPLGAPAAGAVTTFTDVSDYVHAREAIRSSEERYRGLLEALPLMLVQCDLALRITYVNPATTAISGFTLGEIADPAAWAALVHPDDLSALHRVSRSALGGTADSTEYRYRAKDGTEKVAYCISQPRYQHGELVGTTSLIVDLTRERRLERELQRAQRLELVGRLSSGVAHDFNNLLGVVLNLADLARAHLPAEHPVHVDLRRISEASEQAAALASQLLDLSKKRPAPTRRIDLNRVARRTLELLRATLPRGVTLAAELAPGEAAIRADETQAQQVLMNLCLNGRDAMPGGGTLSVRTSVDADGVRLVVADTGQGMSQEMCGRIFEPFFSTKDGGTGLGLMVVQQIVEAHGGRVVVNSEPGRGSLFEVTWPAAG